MTAGAAELQPRLASDLFVLQQQIDSPRRWAAAARLLALYAKTTPGVRESGRWYNLAVVAADRSGDSSVRVWVRGRAALALAYEGNGLTTASTLAAQAVALVGGLSLWKSPTGVHTWVRVTSRCQCLLCIDFTCPGLVAGGASSRALAGRA